MFVRGTNRVKILIFYILLAFQVFFVPGMVSASPYPPVWNGGSGPSVHFPPVSWPQEPVNPAQCAFSCGDWHPYSRFQNDVTDPRVQDPSNGGTAPQNYVNVASSCIDKTLPSIYYNLYTHPTDPTQDVLMFRWRVEQIANTYATGPSAGNFGATDPWNSALWTVLFDLNGDGYRDLAAHLDGSSGSPGTQVDKIVGIWGNTPNHSLDYIGDPGVHLLAHNPTAFVGPGNRILNFRNTLAPVEVWPNGSSESSWDYGTTRARLISTNSCNEYFIDYQIPVKMLDASPFGGPSFTRDTPVSMLFCTANSLNNPFQKDCVINKAWVGDAAKPAPFGDVMTFNSGIIEQPVVSSVTAAPGALCGTYELTTTVQDTLAVENGSVVTSVQSVEFFYYYDTNGNGLADDGNPWVRAAAGTRVPGSLNTWKASWDARSLYNGQYLVGVQALDDRTKVDDGMTPAAANNRTFSYLTGDGQNRIYVGSVSYVPLPDHSPAMTPGSTENWWSNPTVTGVQTALLGIAVNSCGIAPTMSKSVSPGDVAPGGTVTFTLTIGNAGNPNPLTLSGITDNLPAGFTYTATTGGTLTPSSSPIAGSGGTLAWTFSPAAVIPAGGSATLIFTAGATSVAGNYNNTAGASTGFGTLTSNPSSMTVGSARLTLSKTPGALNVNPGDPLTYALAWSNPSTVDITNARIDDTLPAGLTFGSCGGGVSCVNNSGTVTWTLGNVAAGASGTVTLTATVDANYNATSLTNGAVFSAADPAGNPVSTSATGTIAVNVVPAPSPAFTLTKSASVPRVDPGGAVTFTITYSNVGTAAATGVVITDTLPQGFNFSSASGGGTNTGGTVTWNIGNVSAGAGGSVTVTATASNPYTALNPGSNGAVITWSGGTPVTAHADVGVTGQACSSYYFRNETAAVGFDGTKQVATTTPVPQPGDTGSGTLVTVLANAPGTYVEALRFYQDPAAATDLNFNGNITTNIRIDRNPGPGITIRATVYDYDSNSPVGAKTQLGQSETSFLGSQSGLLTFTVNTTGTLLKNHRLLWVYEVTSNNNQSTDILFQYDGTVANSVSDTTPPTFAASKADFCVLPPANLFLSKDVDKVTAAIGDALQYTIRYGNTGQTNATNVILTDVLPAGVTCDSYSLNGGPVQACPVPLSFSLGALAGGTSGVLVISGAVAPGASGTLINSASISSDQTLPVTDTAETSVAGGGGAGSPSLSITIAADKTSAVPGETVTYTVTVINTGTAQANNVTITDILPVAPYYSYGSCSTATGTCGEGGGTLTWDAGSLPQGDAATMTFTMTAGSTGLPAGITQIDDSASVSATGVLPVTSNTITVGLNGNPALVITKSATPDSGLTPGATVTWTIVISNTGSTAASDVTITDPVPGNMTYKAGSLAASAGTGSFDAVRNRVVFSIATLDAGSSATLAFQAVVGHLAAGTTPLSNVATGTAGNAAEAVATAGATATAAPVLNISVTGPESLAFPAAVLTAGAANSTSVSVDDATLFSVGQYVSIGGTVTQIVAVNGNSLSLSAPVTAPAGAGISGSITYTITYQNTGNASATNSILTNPLPAGTVFAAASNGGVFGGGAVTWSLGDLPPGGGGSVQKTVIPTGTGTIVDSATLSGGGLTVTDSAGTVVGGLRITKRTSTPAIAAGGTARYVIEVENTLAVAASDVTVADILPAGFAYAATEGMDVNGTPVTAASMPVAGDIQPSWGTFSVPGGGRLTISFTAGVAGSTGAATYQNETTVTAGGGVKSIPFDPLLTTAEDVTVLAPGTGIVQGIVYRDINMNGSFDPSVDTPLPGVAVQITDSTNTLYIATTDSAGFFTRVTAAGSAVVDIVDADIPAGLVPFIGSVDPATIVVPDGGIVMKNTGYALAAGTGSIGGRVFNDLNGNGVQDAGEPGIGGVVVQLLNGAGTLVASTTTDGNGNYAFVNLPPGAYSVTETNPPGFVSTTPDTATVNVTAGVTSTVNFGDQSAAAATGAVTGLVFNDLNGNGVQDAGEPGLPGVTITLLDNANAVIATTTTDGSGNYAFMNLPPGQYSVSQTVPSGFVGTTNTVVSVTVTPEGVATVVFGDVQGGAVPVPTMTEWGMILFFLIAGGISAHRLRRQSAQFLSGA